MIKVKRLGHATFKTPDLERILDYWSRIIGLSVVERSKDRAFLATKFGEEVIAVEQGDSDALARVSFQVAHRAAISTMCKSARQGRRHLRATQRYLARRRQGAHLHRPQGHAGRDLL